MEKYRKKTKIEVVEVLESCVIVQNEGDPSDRWKIDKETFDNTYEKAE